MRGRTPVLNLVGSALDHAADDIARFLTLGLQFSVRPVDLEMRHRADAVLLRDWRGPVDLLHVGTIDIDLHDHDIVARRMQRIEQGGDTAARRAKVAGEIEDRGFARNGKVRDIHLLAMGDAGGLFRFGGGFRGKSWHKADREDNQRGNNGT